MLEIDRRRFVILTVGGVMLGAEALRADDEDEPKEPVKDEGPASVDVGAASDYAQDGIFDAFAKTNRFFLVRKANRLFAPSAICTHKRCALKLRDGGIVCPCHRSKFNDDGTNKSGPAKIPLPRFGISINSESRIIVDKNLKFEQPQWDAPGAFVELT